MRSLVTHRCKRCVRRSGDAVIPLGWEEVEALGLGRLDGRPEDGVIRRVHDDSRDSRPGDLFVALNTGTRFVGDARARGAATLVPDDQEAALAALAALVRGRSDAQVVAVVGSTGKTTTKDALGALAGAVTPTIAAEASRNNELGLPLTVLRLEPDTRVLVTEMGMRGLGQIAELCAVARPTAALVTLDRARAPRARRDGGGRRAGERRGARRAPRGRHRRGAGRRAAPRAVPPR